MKNKYNYFKKMYPKYVIILEKKGKKISFNYDKLLIKYINNNDISYVIINSDFMINIYYAINNNYNGYLIKEFLYEIINSSR